jgi:hypothetical protein
MNDLLVATSEGRRPSSALLRARGLRHRVARGADLAPAFVDELLALRLRNVSLKKDTDPATDRRKFHAWVQNASWVTWAEDDAGAPRGMFSWKLFRWTHHGAPRVGCVGDYVFVDAPFRGTAVMAGFVLRLLGRILWDARGGEVWLGGAGGYPQSCVALARQLGEVVFLGEPGTPDEARAFLDRLTREADVEASPAGIVTMRTLPQSVSPGWLRRNESEEAYRRYLALNPNWKDGLGLVAATRLSVPSLARGVAIAARRAVKEAALTTRRAEVRP